MPAQSDVMEATGAAPVVDDLSTFVLGGRLQSQLPDGLANTTEVRTPIQGFADAIDAERIGFRRVWLSERFNIKEAATLLSGMAAHTSRLELGTGVIRPSDRHPKLMAAFAATMQACYGPRFVLGLGQGEADYNRVALGLSAAPGYAGLVDYVGLLRQLWRGERVDYDGPAGSFHGLAMGDTYHGDPPPVWYGSFGGPRAARAVAEAFDGIMLCPLLTPGATRAARKNIDVACERIGRDPGTVRVAQCVITAPDLDEFETRQQTYARAVTYMQIDHWAKATVKVNNWDLAPAVRLQQADEFAGMASADEHFHRRDLMEATRFIPDEWIAESCALGTSEQCVDKMLEFRNAGADEIIIYGTTPGQNQGVVESWRARASSGRL